MAVMINSNYCQIDNGNFSFGPKDKISKASEFMSAGCHLLTVGRPRGP